MKVLLVLLVAVVAVAFAGYEKGYARHYEAGQKHTPDGVASNYRNAERQLAVNHVAEHVGSGTGTARWEGVPGTGGNFGYHRNGGYGKEGYAHGHGYGYGRF